MRPVGMARSWQAAVLLASWVFWGMIGSVLGLAAESPPDAVVPLTADVRAIPNVEIRWQSSAGVEQIARVPVQYCLKGTDVVLLPVWAVLGPVEKQTDKDWQKLVSNEPLPTDAPMTLRFRVCNLLAKDRMEVTNRVRDLLSQTHGMPKETFRFHQPKMELPAYLSLWVSLEGQGERMVSQMALLDRVHAEGPEGEYVRISLSPGDLKNASQVLGKPVTADRLHVQIETRIFSQLETKQAFVRLQAISQGWTELREKIQSAAGNQVIDYVIFPSGGQAEAEHLLRHYLLQYVSVEIAVREGEKADLSSIAETFVRHALDRLRQQDLSEEKRILLLLDREIGLAGTVGEIKKLASQGRQEREDQLKEFLQQSSKIESKLQASLFVPILLGSTDIRGSLGTGSERSQQGSLDQAHKALDEFSQLLEGRLPTLTALRLDAQKQEEVVKVLQANLEQQKFITDYFTISSPLLALPVSSVTPADPVATLLAEIENAPPGAKIQLERGRYVLRDTIRLKKPLQFIGSGTGRTFFAAPDGKPILSYEAPGELVLEKITWEYTENAPGNLIEIHDGVFRIEDCQVQGAVQDPNKAEESGVPNTGWGVWVGGAARGQLLRCQFRHNQGGGIRLAHKAVVQIEDCLCENNGIGIAFTDSASGTAKNNICRQNKGSGILLANQANPILEENQCLENEKCGIAYFGDSSGTARKNTCQKNKQYGIYAGHKAQPILEENRCLENEWSGIAYGGDSSGTARNNTCQKNKRPGIYVDEKAQPILEENQCLENDLSGIAYFGNSSGTARKNTCQHNLTGILVCGKAQPLLEENQCVENVWSGIAYYGDGSGMARKNTCEENFCHGIYVGQAAYAELLGNRCIGNGDSGITIRGLSRGATLTDNYCARNGYGIQIGPSAWFWRGDVRVLKPNQTQPEVEESNRVENNRSYNWSWNMVVE